MHIYRHETSQTAASGSVSSTTLNIRGALLRQVLIRSGTDSTLFKVNITESGGIVVLNYGYHEGEINDTGLGGALPLPVLGNYNINITNASRDDSFDVRLLCEE